jgi:hypothetical protein
MIFLGANVFFPKYTGDDSYYHNQDCYLKYPTLTNCNLTQQQEIGDKQSNCINNDEAARIIWENERNNYDGQKYTFIVLFNLIILLVALLVKKLNDSVCLGLFSGSIISTFASTLTYFDSKSRIGFIILVIIFIVALVFINKKKDSFLK